MRFLASLSALLAAAFALAGCETLKPYEKEFLLNPAMDDSALGDVDATMMSSAAQAFEKLGKGGPGAGGGSACPTCGG